MMFIGGLSGPQSPLTDPEPAMNIMSPAGLIVGAKMDCGARAD